MKKTIYTMKLVVEGRRPFPIDMLRYDSCVPATEADAHIIERALSGMNLGGPAVRVVLRRYAVDKDARDRQVSTTGANARWESHGWKIITYDEEN